MGNLSFKKKVGIKQAAERENEFHKTLTFNILQNGKQGDFDHIKRLLETYLFLPLDRLVSQLVTRIRG